MDDETFERQKARILEQIERWVKPLGLNWWRLNFTYIRERCEDQPGTAMEVLTRWQYRHAGIKVFMPAIADMEDDELEEAFVHELMHVCVNQMRDDQGDCTLNEERVCSDLATAIIWLRDSLVKQEPDAVDVSPDPSLMNPVDVRANGHAPAVLAEVV